MSYRILFTEQAHRDLRKACKWWVLNGSAGQADEWFNGFAEAVHLAGGAPERFPTAREAPSFSPELRQFSYGLAKHPTHRAIFTVQRGTIFILRIRHLARKWFALEGI